MSRARFVELRNWGKYQHYRDRRPPWIKLYPEIIDPVANPDLAALPVQSRYLAFVMLCLAWKTENLIPASPGWIASEAGMTTAQATRALNDLRSIGFVHSAGINGASKSGDNIADESYRPREERTEGEILANARISPGGRPLDEIWETLAELYGPVARGTQAHKRRNKAVADLKKLGATPETLRLAHRRWFRVFEGATPTDIGLATHFPRLMVGVSAAPKPPCPECGVGGGLHSAECPTVNGKEPS